MRTICQCGSVLDESAQVESGLAEGYLQSCTHRFWRGGLIYSGLQNGKKPAFPLVYCIPPAKPAALSVKCSGSPLLTWGVQFIVGVVSSGIGGFNLGGVGGILSVVAAKAGLKAMAI